MQIKKQYYFLALYILSSGTFSRVSAVNWLPCICHKNVMCQKERREGWGGRQRRSFCVGGYIFYQCWFPRGFDKEHTMVNGLTI